MNKQYYNYMGDCDEESYFDAKIVSYIDCDTSKDIKIIEKELKNKKAVPNVYHDFKMLYPKDWREKLKEYLPLVADKADALYFYINSFQKETLEYIRTSTNYEVKKKVLLFGLGENLFHKVNFSKKEKKQYINDLIEEIGNSRHKVLRQLTFLFKEIAPEQFEKIVNLKNREEAHIMNVAQFLFIHTLHAHKNNNILLDNYSELLSKDIEIIKMKEYLKIKSSIISFCYNEGHYMKVLPFAPHFNKLQECDKSYLTACVIKYLSPKNDKSIKCFEYIDTQRLQEIKAICNHNKSKNEFFELLLEKKLIDSSIKKDTMKNDIYKL